MASAVGTRAGCTMRATARAGDEEHVSRLVEESGYFSSEECRIARELIEDAIRKGEESSYRFVFCEHDGATLGYACYGRIPCTQACYDLYWIVVSASHRREGLGRRILEEVENQARASGGRRLYVDTAGRSQYAPTRAFYRDAGYEVAAVLDDFYAPGDDKVIFAKSLKS